MSHLTVSGDSYWLTDGIRMKTTGTTTEPIDCQTLSGIVYHDREIVYILSHGDEYLFQN